MVVNPSTSEAREASEPSMRWLRDFARKIGVRAAFNGESGPDAWEGWTWEHGIGECVEAFAHEYDALTAGIESLRDMVSEEFPIERRAA